MIPMPSYQVKVRSIWTALDATTLARMATLYPDTWAAWRDAASAAALVHPKRLVSVEFTIAEDRNG